MVEVSRSFFWTLYFSLDDWLQVSATSPFMSIIEEVFLSLLKKKVNKIHKTMQHNVGNVSNVKLSLRWVWILAIELMRCLLENFIVESSKAVVMYGSTTVLILIFIVAFFF